MVLRRAMARTLRCSSAPKHSRSQLMVLGIKSRAPYSSAFNVLLFCAALCERADHQHGNRSFFHQLLQNSKAIKPWKVNIKRHYVRIKFFGFFQGGVQASALLPLVEEFADAREGETLRLQARWMSRRRLRWPASYHPVRSTSRRREQSSVSIEAHGGGGHLGPSCQFVKTELVGHCLSVRWVEDAEHDSNDHEHH